MAEDRANARVGVNERTKPTARASPRVQSTSRPTMGARLQTYRVHFGAGVDDMEHTLQLGIRLLLGGHTQ